MHTPKMTQFQMRFIREIVHRINRLKTKTNTLKNKTGMDFCNDFKY